MDEQPWERMNEEPNNWYSRFMLYLQAGPSRSLLGTVNAERDKKRLKKINYLSQAWTDAAKQWNWKARAEAYDEYRRKQVFTSGNAYDVARIEKLNRYSERLETEVDKMLDALPKEIKKPWFNQFLYEKYLQTLEALAAETGGRVKKQDLNIGFDDGNIEQELVTILTRFAGGEHEQSSDASQRTS